MQLGTEYKDFGRTCCFHYQHRSTFYLKYGSSTFSENLLPIYYLKGTIFHQKFIVNDK